MGGFNEGFNGLDYDTGQGRMLMYAGEAAMELMGSWEAANFLAENPEFFNNMGVFPFPAVEGGARSDERGRHRGRQLYHIAPSCEYGRSLQDAPVP